MTPKTYFGELPHALWRRELLSRVAEEDGLLPVEWNSRPLCRITGSDATRYDPTWVATDQAEVALVEAVKAAGAVTEYMALLGSAPLLKAEYLEAGYRVLTDFNGVVLAGKEMSLGAQFAAWARGYNRKGLNNGRYYRENRQGTKEDFTLHAGLMTREQVFDQEQLEGLRQAVQGLLYGKAPASYQQGFQC